MIDYSKEETLLTTQEDEGKELANQDRLEEAMNSRFTKMSNKVNKSNKRHANSFRILPRSTSHQKFSRFRFDKNRTFK